MTVIKEIKLRKILDSRGNPTVEVDIITPKGSGTCAAPSGASTGKYEVLAYPSKGIDFAIENFKTKVVPRLLGRNVTNQTGIDLLLHELDGTENFSKFGGNITTAVSLAVARAAASSLNVSLYRYLNEEPIKSLPYPLGNVLGGGKHAIGGTDIQEYLVISTPTSMKEAVFANAKVYKKVKEKLQKKLPDTAIGKGDECAWVAKLGNLEALELVKESCDETAKELKIQIKPALDMAASEFYSEGKYHYKEQTLDENGQIEFVSNLIDKYGLAIVEDTLHQDDFEGYARLTKKVGKKCLIVGDDLFVTNSTRLQKGIRTGAANAVLIKVNQIGTLTDTIKTIQLAHKNNYKTIISHRSGETTDNTIAHIAVAYNAYAIKTGVVGGERIAKLNELIRIEEELKGVY